MKKTPPTITIPNWKASLQRIKILLLTYSVRKKEKRKKKKKKKRRKPTNTSINEIIILI